MYSQTEMGEYMAEIRERVCSRCIERPPGGPPCLPHGKSCGIELHLRGIVDLCHSTHSDSMEPYIEELHKEVCANCSECVSSQCPCPLHYLLLLATEAIDAVDERRLSQTSPSK
jgi:hypothetical protein